MTKKKLTEQELSLLQATLQFAHLNRQAFYNYLSKHSHPETIEYFENNNHHNDLRRKLSKNNPPQKTKWTKKSNSYSQNKTEPAKKLN